MFQVIVIIIVHNQLCIALLPNALPTLDPASTVCIHLIEGSSGNGSSNLVSCQLTHAVTEVLPD